MKSKNSLTEIEYVLLHIWWLFVGGVAYHCILFRCLGDFTLKQSRGVLLGLVFVWTLVGVVSGWNKRRNGMSIYINLTGGFGIYTFLAYYPYKQRLEMAVMLIMLVLAVGYSALVLCRKVRNRKKIFRAMRRRIVWVLHANIALLNFGLVVIMFVLTINVLFGKSLVRNTVDAIRWTENGSQTIDNNMDTIVLLQDYIWEELTLQERLEVLQVVANIEQTSLGLPHELNVITTNCDEFVTGRYHDAKHEIIISIDCLLQAESQDVVGTVCHEARHAAQRRIIDAYDDVRVELKSLEMFQEAAIFKEEFANPVDSAEDISGYFHQKTEIDAYAYSDRAKKVYFERINEYVGDQPE